MASVVKIIFSVEANIDLNKIEWKFEQCRLIFKIASVIKKNTYRVISQKADIKDFL